MDDSTILKELVNNNNQILVPFGEYLELKTAENNNDLFKKAITVNEYESYDPAKMETTKHKVVVINKKIMENIFKAESVVIDEGGTSWTEN
jgi:hypothetical protein